MNLKDNILENIVSGSQDYQKKIQVRERKIINLTEALRRSEEERRRLEEEKARQESLIENLQKNLQILQEKQTEIVASLQSKQTVEAEKEALQRSHDELKEAQMRYAEQMEENKQQLSRQIVELQKSGQEAQLLVQEAQKRAIKAENDLVLTQSKAMHDVNELQQQLDEKNAIIEIKDKEIDAQHSQLNELQSILEKLQNELSSQSTQLLAKNKHAHQLEHTIKDMTGEQERLYEQLVTASNELAQVKQIQIQTSSDVEQYKKELQQKSVTAEQREKEVELFKKAFGDITKAITEFGNKLTNKLEEVVDKASHLPLQQLQNVENAYNKLGDALDANNDRYWQHLYEIQRKVLENRAGDDDYAETLGIHMDSSAVDAYY